MFGRNIDSLLVSTLDPKIKRSIDIFSFYCNQIMILAMPDRKNEVKTERRKKGGRKKLK